MRRRKKNEAVCPCRTLVEKRLRRHASRDSEAIEKRKRLVARGPNGQFLALRILTGAIIGDFSSGRCHTTYKSLRTGQPRMSVSQLIRLGYFFLLFLFWALRPST